MDIKNLSRAKEIAEALPKLEDARKILSNMDEDTTIKVIGRRSKKESEQTTTVELPRGIHMNIVNILNLEINSLKEEAKKL